MIGSYHLTKVLGIPIKVHLTLIIFLPTIAMQIAKVTGIQSVAWGLLAAVGLFASVAFHELGHSLVALSKGIRVREILLLPIGGLAQLDRMPDQPRDEFEIALAGPAASLVLALGFGLLAWLSGGAESGLVAYTWYVLSGMNWMLALFNLLPSFPMDGGRIFRAWLSPRIGRIAATRVAAKTGRVLAILFGLVGLLPPVNFMLILVAVFVYLAAGAEYRMVVAQEQLRRPFGPFTGTPTGVDDEPPFVVGPPPYARRQPDWAAGWRKLIRRQRDLFERLFDEWSQR